MSRLLIDITLHPTNKRMEAALREIIALDHQHGGIDHEVYDIAMSALPPWRPKRFRWFRSKSGYGEQG